VPALSGADGGGADGGELGEAVGHPARSQKEDEMAEGLWVVLGTVVGTTGSLGTTWLKAHLDRKSPHPKFDKAVEGLLKRMLEDGPSWRKLETLARVTGLSEKDTREYLIEIEARGSEKDDNLWGLISRNPLRNVADDN
jgi:hypothetical protein